MYYNGNYRFNAFLCKIKDTDADIKPFTLFVEEKDSPDKLLFEQCFSAFPEFVVKGSTLVVQERENNKLKIIRF